jgi:putative hydrolase of the HAD superfamily
MNERKYWVLADLDDTLGGVEIEGEIHGTAEAYNHALRKYAARLEKEGFDRDQAHKVQQEIDMKLCKKYGFGDRSRFGRSMVDAYNALGGKNPKVAQELESIGWSVFTHPYRALPGAIPMLSDLHQFYKVAIVTKGHDDEQRKKVFDMGLWPYADQIIVVEHKNHNDWERIINMLKIDLPTLTRSWAVGNSLKSDVNIPMEMGLNGIHLKAYTWAFEEATPVEPMPGRKFYVINDISETLKYVPIPA